MLNQNKRLFAYPFKGYWKDVGTVHSLWEANMDLLDPNCELHIFSSDFKIYSADRSNRPQFISPTADVKDCVINQGAIVRGEVRHSVICSDVVIEKNTHVHNSVILPGAVIKEGVNLDYALVGGNTVIDKDQIGTKDEVVLVNVVEE